MVEPVDLLYLALLAVAWPLFDHLVIWKGFQGRMRVAPARARRWLWTATIVQQWGLVAIGVGLWLHFARPWAALKFMLPEGWRLAAAVAMVVAFSAYQVYCLGQLRSDPALRARVRASFGELAEVMPHSRAELQHFTWVSATAGFCEEFLFRGYFLWALAPWLGWWGAAAVSVPFFGLLHAYQGWRGVVRTALVGACFVMIVAVLQSLWPAIVLHALVDAFAGGIAWRVLREDATPSQRA